MLENGSGAWGYGGAEGGFASVGGQGYDCSQGGCEELLGWG